VTFDGLTYEYRFFRVEGTIRAYVSVEAANHDTMDEASVLRTAVEGYWFEVSADAFERMARPLEQAATRSVSPVRP
jgi:hypothetical protein